MAWKAFTGRLEPWHKACIEHDRTYWRGGTRKQRKEADIKLMIDVARTGHPFWAFFMYVAVRIGGHPALPFSWRWGFGHKRKSGYVT
jgi:hypothetical protein